MVASALNHCFRHCLQGQLSDATELHLFSDSCYGQNKNMNVLSMLFALRKQRYPNLRITFTFPVRGHSFLPADRVFGRVEQDIRRKNTILLPEEYFDILRRHGTLLAYPTNWQALDFKKAAAAVLRSTRSFKISQARMLEVNGNELGLKTAFNGDFCQHAILKRGKNWAQFKPANLPLVSTVKRAKKKDVLSLLEGIGADDTVCAFYTDALALPTTSTEIVDSDSDSDSAGEDI